MKKFFMNGKLTHKASDHNTKRCEVEKWVFLPHSDFEKLKANPYQEHEAITAARDLMYEDKNAYHCIMLLDEYGDDGLLIEAEGFDYPRLSMFVPDAKSIYDRYQTSEPEIKLHDMIKDTVEKIAELAHTDKTDFTSADMINMDEVESLVKNAIVQQLAQRDDIKIAENTDIGVEFQSDIHVEAKELTELKFYCPLNIQREIRPSFDEDEDEFLDDTEELSDYESLEYESEISSAIEAYQCDEEENCGIMAYLGDRKRFADKVYSIFPSVEKVGDRLLGVFICQICGELDSYEYDELLQELSGQASDGWGEGFEQHEIHTPEGDIHVSFYDTNGAWELMTEKEVKAAPVLPSEDVELRM
ncbi:DUF6329 domain-containing protein [Ruminococcus flavefaciens]|uniref:DUF6329 domain-containing protein n=1 Tax=Ruminococcus flavefaciens TaxID=1265 RepID=UPI0006882D54|nr:DUF6329 domain-containing protein [Ruminococcus flavefaciens]